MIKPSPEEIKAVEMIARLAPNVLFIDRHTRPRCNAQTQHEYVAVICTLPPGHKGPHVDGLFFMPLHVKRNLVPKDKLVWYDED